MAENDVDKLVPPPMDNFELDPKDSPRLLVVRSDRLGDVVLSTPVFEVIKKHYSKARVTALVQSHVVPLLKGLASVDHFLVFEPQGRHLGLKGFLRLCADIRRRRFQIAVVLQSHWKIAAALWIAGVRYRIGPLSKFYSYLFYNRGLRQSRSQVEMHETDYNLQLLRKIGIRVGSRNIPTRVSIPQSVVQEARSWLEQKGWQSHRKLIAIHPGMGGSALNWPESHYLNLIQTLVQENHQVLITGGVPDRLLLDRIVESLGVAKESAFIYQAQPQGSVDFLGALYSHADLVVAPSTGPLHVAVALGKPVVTFYPPIRVQSALRWGPYLSDESQASILVPEVYCGEDFKCRGSHCHYFPCMKSLTVKQAVEQVHLQIKAGDLKRDDKN